MIVAVQKSTGKIIEMQSDATPGTLIANAVAAGFSEADVVERETSPEEYKALMEVQEPPVHQGRLTAEGLATALIGKGVLTEKDVNDARSGK